jgi:uncharacterized protein YerC
MNTPEEMNRFFRDLCSVNELHSFLHRWQIVRRIEQNKSYEEIIKELSPKETEDISTDTETSEDSGKRRYGRTKGKSRASTKVSSTTISRVKNCYVNPEGGYRTALDRLKANDEKNKKKFKE